MKSSSSSNWPSELTVIPLRKAPSLCGESSCHERRFSEDCATSSFDISIQLSNTVAFVGMRSAVKSDPPSEGLTASGPRHSERSAWAIGTNSIKAVRRIARRAFVRDIY